MLIRVRALALLLTVALASLLFLSACAQKTSCAGWTGHSGQRSCDATWSQCDDGEVRTLRCRASGNSFSCECSGPSRSSRRFEQGTCQMRDADRVTRATNTACGWSLAYTP